MHIVHRVFQPFSAVNQIVQMTSAEQSCNTRLISQCAYEYTDKYLGRATQTKKE